MLSGKTVSNRFMQFTGFGFYFGWGYFCYAENEPDTVGKP